MSVLFGVAGNSDTFTKTVSKASADAPAWLHAIGLDAYEYQCGKGVRVGEATARQIGENAAQVGITLSLHAPYFISLANPDPETVQKSIGYVTASCRAAQWMGAGRVIVHSGALMKRTRREALDIAKANLKAILDACDQQGYGDITLCPETMGKINQLDEMADALGEARASRFHSHFSKIAFTSKGGEQKHLRFSDEGWGPEFRPLAEEIARRGWSPTFICESSGTQSEDALTMKAIYQEVSRS